MDLVELEGEGIRNLMLQEFKRDLNNESLYLSPRIKEEFYDLYKNLLENAITKGNPESFALKLSEKRILKSTVPRNTKKGLIFAKMPVDAVITLAEGEFNRFYIRAVCLKAINENKEIEVYRAKQVKNPRSESQFKIGKTIDSKKLLDDLRKNIGIDTALGIPSGPNSGLSIRFKDTKKN